MKRSGDNRGGEEEKMSAAHVVDSTNERDRNSKLTSL